jgi:plastocyanin
MRSLLFPSIIVSVLLLSACTASAPSAPSEQNSSATPASSSQSSAGGTEGHTKTFDMEAFSYGFKPSTLEVNKGDTVVIHVKNTGGFHDFTLADFNVKVNTPANQTTDVTFTADKAGTFEFICSVGNHAAQGMKGTLTVK